MKKALYHPPGPEGAETPSFPSFVLGLRESSTYRTRGRASLELGVGA
jgi:hypothetical protein